MGGRRCLAPPSPWFLIVKYMFLIHLDMFWLGGSVYNIYRCALLIYLANLQMGDRTGCSDWSGGKV